MAEQDDLVRAILIVFNQQPGQDPQVKAQANALCEQLKASPTGYVLCLERLLQRSTAVGPDEVKFWLLDVVYQTIKKRYQHIVEKDRAFIRQCLMMYLKDVVPSSPQPPFVKNKLCSTLIAIVKIDYPERWPTFFTEFLEMIRSSSREHVDCFLRCLKMFDEEIVLFDINRGRAEVEHNTLIKDTIRETVMEHIILTIQQILEGCLNADAEDVGLVKLATLALEVLCEYIGWNDVGLIANANFVGLLYRLMHNESLRDLATECVAEVVYKRMFAHRKIMLIKHLNIISILASIQVDSGDESFIVETSSLLNTLGLQLVICTERGRKVQQKAPKDDVLTREVDTEATAMLLQVIEIGFRFLGHSSFLVVEQVTELFCAYVNVLKQGAFTPEDQKHAQLIFEALVNAMQFPPWYNFDQPSDDEAKFELFRGEIKKILLNLTRGATYDCVGFIRAHVGALLEPMGMTGSSVPPSPFRVEAMLQVLYLLVESIPMSRLQQDAPFWEMLARVLTSPYFANKNLHSQAQIMYFQLCRRYPLMFERQPNTLLGVVTSFIDERGIASKHPTVRSQACYLFFKLVASFSKEFLAILAPLMDSLLEAIKRAITPFFVKMANHQSQNLEHTGHLDANEVQYMCELLGILVGVSVTGAKCRFYYDAVLRFFQEQQEASLQHKDIWMQNELQAEMAGTNLSHIIDSVAHFSKTMDQATKKIVIDLMKTPLDTVIQVYLLLPKHTQVRAATISFLHRMTDCLGEQVLPYLPNSLQVLLNHSEPSNLVSCLQLINQCVVKFKGALSGTMEVMMMPVVNKTSECIQSYAYVDDATSAYTSDLQERLLLFKVYYSFIKAIVETFPDIFASERNQPHLHTVLDTVVRGCLNPEDATVNKACYRILFVFTCNWEKRGTHTNPEVQRFVMQDLTSKMFETICAPYLNPKDAATASLLREIINLQVRVLKIFHDPYLNRIGEHLVGSGWPPHIVQEYCMLLTKGNQKGLRQLLTRVMEERQKATSPHSR